jgi:hypothetical protein
MISAKLAVLKAAAMIIVGVTAPVLAEAQTAVNTTRSNIKATASAQSQDAYAQMKLK